MLPALVALAVCAAPSSLEQAAQAVEELRADEAIKLLEKAQTEGPWSHAEHARLYEQLGIAHAYLGRTDAALAAFGLLLAIDPGYALRYTLSPKVTFLFEKARAQARAHPAPGLDVSWPRDGKIDAPLPITLEVVSDPAGFMKRVTLGYRVRGQGQFRLLAEPLRAPGTYLSLTLPAEERQESTVRELFAVVTDARGNEVFKLGSEAFPREAPAAYLPPLRWYQRWWVWSLIGTAVTASAGFLIWATTRPPWPTVSIALSTPP